MSEINIRTRRMIGRFAERYFFATSSQMADMWRRKFVERAYLIERARTKRLREQLAYERERANAWALAAAKLGCTGVKLGDWEADQ